MHEAGLRPDADAVRARADAASATAARVRAEGDVVARCAALQILATSRAPLKIGAESEFPLPPLELPDEREHAPDRLHSPAE